MEAIVKQLWAAVSRRAYPTAYIPMKYWSWRWNKLGNVKYRQCRTLWNYTTAQSFEWFTDVAGILVFGVLGLAALAGVVFAGATHQLVMVGISAAMVSASIAEIRREERRAKAKNSTNQ